MKGLTLTELLVSTVLMSIVMGGIASFSLFIKQARDSTSAGAILAMQATAAMHYIVEDANKAVGDEGNPGVVEAVEAEVSAGICFRIDINNTPALYADDNWACYWYDAGTLFKCAVAVAPSGSFAGCSNALRLVTVSSFNILNPYFQIVNDANGRLQYVDITLNTISDPTQAADPIKNPTYQLSTRVSFPMHGR